MGCAMASSVGKAWGFLNKRKKYWLVPLVLVVVLFGGLVLMSQRNGVGAFNYSLF
jgi:hypothetical protein